MSPQTLILGTAMASSKESSGSGQAELLYAANMEQMPLEQLTVLNPLDACYRLTCCWLMSSHVSMLCFLQWYRSAASQDRVFTVQVEERVTLVHLSNSRKMRQDKA